MLRSSHSPLPDPYSLMSFSTKYRPQTFDDVVEQSHIISIIKQQLWQHYNAVQDYLANGGMFPAAPNYLLYGPR